MTMTKTQFELIARVLSECRDDIMRQDYVRTQASDAAHMDYIALRFATVLSETNPRFDRGRFLVACGVDVTP